MMTKLTDIPDAEIERLFAGLTPSDDGLEGVAQFLADMAAEYPGEPTTALEASHVSAMLEAATTIESSTVEDGLASRIARHWRMLGMFTPSLAENGPSSRIARNWRMLGSFAQRVAGSLGWVGGADGTLPPRVEPARHWKLSVNRGMVATAVSLTAVLAYSGAAVAGVLPAPIQQATSDLVGHVGISIPTPGHARIINRLGAGENGPGSNNGRGTIGAQHSVETSGAGIGQAGNAGTTGAQNPAGQATTGSTGNSANAGKSATAGTNANTSAGSSTTAKKSSNSSSGSSSKSSGKSNGKSDSSSKSNGGSNSSGGSNGKSDGKSNSSDKSSSNSNSNSSSNGKSNSSDKSNSNSNSNSNGNSGSNGNSNSSGSKDNSDKGSSSKSNNSDKDKSKN